MGSFIVVGDRALLANILTEKRWLINISVPLLPAANKEELEKVIEDSKPWKVEEMISNFAKNINEMKKEEWAKGKIEGKMETAEKLLEKGMTTVEIAEVTGLDEEKIEKIKDKIQH